MLLMQTPWEKHLLGPRLLAGNGHSKPRMNLVMKRLEMIFSQIKEVTNLLFKAKLFKNKKLL